MAIKRVFDLILTVPVLIILLPLFIVIAIWIKLGSSGPVFFRQIRVGHHGRNFKIFKFRTMGVDAEKKGQLTIGNDNRVTKSGKWLRQYKLDELPQLLNVLKGDMSLVGPRPEVPRYIALYPEKSHKLILSVLPGITDLSSINFIDESKILGKSVNPEKTYIEEILPRKIQYYEDYARQHSLWLDLRIIFTTLTKLFKNRDHC